jgi:hypothetical protein
VKKLLLLLSIIFFIGTQKTFATHIVGGELVYEHLGGSQYAITLIVYRDCLSGQAPFDDPAAIGIFNSSGSLVQSLNFSLDSIVTLQSTINSSCVTAPNNVCTEAGYYTEIATLPPIPDGYTISYQRCCRNAIIQNIQDPGDVGATYVATIPGSESQPDNSSPFWNNLPPLYVCVNLPFEFNHSAFLFVLLLKVQVLPHHNQTHQAVRPTRRCSGKLRSGLTICLEERFHLPLTQVQDK